MLFIRAAADELYLPKSLQGSMSGNPVLVASLPRRSLFFFRCVHVLCCGTRRQTHDTPLKKSPA